MIPSKQEFIVFIIVAYVVLRLSARIFVSYLSAPLASWFLKRGKVKWAMRLRQLH